LLDVDTVGGTSKDAALATQASMNNLKVNDEDNTHLLCDEDCLIYERSIITNLCKIYCI